MEHLFIFADRCGLRSKQFRKKAAVQLIHCLFAVGFRVSCAFVYCKVMINLGFFSSPAATAAKLFLAPSTPCKSKHENQHNHLLKL